MLIFIFMFFTNICYKSDTYHFTSVKNDSIKLKFTKAVRKSLNMSFNILRFFKTNAFYSLWLIIIFFLNTHH